jgi:aspartyl-tRNA(Asn)/glutamyl-tRNA(Gln) amidotransferase subunit B
MFKKKKDTMEYELVVGLEIHVQLNTKTKLFASDPNNTDAIPNQNVGEITFALPGTLPRLNKEAVLKAIKLGLACKGEISRYCVFDRKNYFYPDLPKGYQTTQDTTPIVVGGSVETRLADGTYKTVVLNRIHLEEDAGKSTHLENSNFSAIDLNRAGKPLVEIVTEPCIRSADEAFHFMHEMRKLVRHLGVSEANLEEGSMRCDANVSIRPKGSEEYGSKVEIKNMNSMKNVQKAITIEYERQVAVLQKGGTIESETRDFRVEENRTVGMRSKEMANDYRYFPDPDLVPFTVSDKELEDIKRTLPHTPQELFEIFHHTYKLPVDDAIFLSGDRGIANYYQELVLHTSNHKQAANWLTGPIKSYLNTESKDIEDFLIRPAYIAEIIEMVADGTLNRKLAIRDLFPALLAEPDHKPLLLAENLNLILDKAEISGELEKWVDAAVQKFPDKVKAFNNGKKNLIGLFMGEVMKASKGKANAKEANELLRNKLKELA